MSMSLPSTVNAPARPDRILTALTESPGLGAYELAAALGYDGRRTAAALKRMQFDGEVVALELARPGAGRPARIYFAAPEGTPPLPRRKETAAEAEERRRRSRIQQRQRRARLARNADRIGKPRRDYRTTTKTGLGRQVRVAACRTADPDLFFGPVGEAPESRGRRVAQARAVCFSCPIRLACLEVARANRETYGVWGGVDLETERGLRSAQATRPAVAAADRA